MVIAHLSDTHLGERGVNADRLHQIAKHIRARHDAGEEIACALTGDCTHDGQLAEWVDLQAAVEPLRGHVPLWIVPGNHDVAHLGIAWDRARAMQAEMEIGVWADVPLRTLRGLRVWEWCGHKIIGLDSTRGRAVLARGEIGAEQLAALEVELQDDQPTVILLHHHPRWAAAEHALVDREAVLALIQRRPHVKAVLYGHQHLEATWGSEGSRRWLCSGKVTDLDADGRLRYRTIDLATGRVREVTLPAP